MLSAWAGIRTKLISRVDPQRRASARFFRTRSPASRRRILYWASQPILRGATRRPRAFIGWRPDAHNRVAWDVSRVSGRGRWLHDPWESAIRQIRPDVGADTEGRTPVRNGIGQARAIAKTYAVLQVTDVKRNLAAPKELTAPAATPELEHADAF